MNLLSDLRSRFSTTGKLLSFFVGGSWWWLTPMVVLLFLFGFLVVFAQTSAVAPFIYTLF